MPDFLNHDLAALHDRVAALARGPLAALRDDDTLAPAGRAAQVRALSKDAGLFGLLQDGSTPALTVLVVRETLARHNVGHLPGLFGPQAGLLAGVAEPLRSSHLLPMLAGDKRSGFAFTEPGDAPRPTWAVVDGDQPGGHRPARVMSPAVPTPTSWWPWWRWRARARPWWSSTPLCPACVLDRRFGSLDGSHHAAFRFDAVRVPRAHAIGAPGEGRSRALAQISAVRRLVAADALGTACWAVDFVGAELLRERRGGPRAASERMRLRYGAMRVQAYAARATVYRCARLHDSGADAVNESIAAKVFATEVAGQLVDLAVQLVGGEALVTGHPLEAALRRLRALRLAEGETDVLQVNLARGHLDLGKGGL